MTDTVAPSAEELVKTGFSTNYGRACTWEPETVNSIAELPVANEVFNPPLAKALINP
jgi:hypothetical protein